MKKWVSKTINELVTELPKSRIPIENANNYGIYPFFTSGNDILKYDNYIVDGENIYLADGGSANIKYYNGKCAYSSHTWGLTTNNIRCKYIYYWILNKLYFIDYFYFAGSGLKNIKKPDFLKLLVYYPENINEQDKIIKLLDVASNIILETQKIIDKYKLIKKGFVNDLIFKKSETKNDLNEIVVKNKNWIVDKLENHCGKIIDGNHNAPYGVDLPTEYKMLSSTNIGDYGFINLEKCRNLTKEVFIKENERTKLTKGNILFASVGSIGKSFVFNGNGNYVFQRSVTVISTYLNPYYLKAVFDSDQYQKKFTNSSIGTAQKGFYLNQVRELSIPIPKDNLNLQIEIANKINKLDSVITKEYQVLEKYKHSFSGLLQELLYRN